MCKEGKVYNTKQLRILRTLFFRQVNERPFLRITQGEEKQIFNTIHECASYLASSTEHVWGHFVTQLPLKGWMISHIKHNDSEAVDRKSYYFTRRPIEESNFRVKRPVKVYDIETQQIETFASLSACGKHYGAKASHVRLRITVPEKIRLLYQRYIIIDANCSFNFLTPSVLKRVMNQINYGVAVYNGRDNTVTFYSGVTAFMRLQKREKDIENASRLLHYKGIYTISQHHFMMKMTSAMNTMSKEEIAELFLAKIRFSYTYNYQHGK